jgi:uncharacterized membrane protein AbrB (regulator of aidB expression)
MKKIVPPREAIIWLMSLLALAFYSPQLSTHITICPLSTAGFDFCPGCGLGRSIAYFFHGEVIDSFHAHPFGIFAVIVLTYRIIILSFNHYKRYGKSY